MLKVQIRRATCRKKDRAKREADLWRVMTQALWEVLGALKRGISEVPRLEQGNMTSSLEKNPLYYHEVHSWV